MLLNVHSILHLKEYTLQVSQMLTSVASTTRSPSAP
jgi:hypothetical protein